MFGVTILGNNSAVPAYNRHPTAQIVTIEDQLLLIDCGEGTQMQIARYKVRWSKIKYIFISHLHGDHYFGLIGLITSMCLLGRTDDLHIYAPALLEKIIKIQLDAADTIMSFKIHFSALGDDGLIVDENLKNFAASPDGINSLGIMIEIKCPFSREIKDNYIPKKYIMQIQGQLKVCNLNECDYIECDFKEYPSEIDYLSENELDLKNHGIIAEYKLKTGEYYYLYSVFFLKQYK